VTLERIHPTESNQVRAPQIGPARVGFPSIQRADENGSGSPRIKAIP
jgi:hypothetical protein